MTELGSGVRVVEVRDDHTYELNLPGLESILMREEVKDLPVVVVSLAGAYRGGKSFMLNFFLRYLNAPETARKDGTWVGTDSEPLTGFSWRGGYKRNTTGILLWSEPILTSLPSGQKVAVLLMDTQGTFDSSSTVRDCSTIFALSTLLSSVQVYNLPGGIIQEDDLQHLQLFTEYGKLMNQHSNGEKAFQVLEFLVRDWTSEDEHSYGSAGGQGYLDEVLQVKKGMAKELTDLRQHIRSSFETVSCFLMPHPGLKCRKKDFTGSIGEIEPDFVKSLKELASSLFGPEKLKVKMINGHAVKASSLFTYISSYMNIFNSKTIPTPTSIMKATSEAGLLVAVNTCREQYEARMNAACGDKMPSVPAADLKEIHIREMHAAREAFNSIKKMGPKEDAQKYLEKLTQDLDSRLPMYMTMNMKKTQDAVIEAKKAYEKKILEISGNNPLCVHAADLLRFHDDAVAAAIALFDAKRKRSNGKDNERAAFIESFKQQYSLLKNTNEQNNKLAVSDIVDVYEQTMQALDSAEPPLSSAQFEQEHQRALDKALTEFKDKRNRPDFYNEDVFKTKLKEQIKAKLQSLKSMNKSRNKEAIKRAYAAYKEFMTSRKPAKGKCLHLDDLYQDHESAKCRSLQVFRPHKECSDGFDPNDEDETILLDLIKQEFASAQDLNYSANQNAVLLALNLYKSKMDELCRPSIWWLLIVPIFVYLSKKGQYHEESKASALALFYSNRESRGYHEQDFTRDHLYELIDSAHADY